MRRQPRLLAGLDILGPEITLVGDDIDFLEPRMARDGSAFSCNRPMSTT
jgi:hypothetical protein